MISIIYKAHKLGKKTFFKALKMAKYVECCAVKMCP